MFFTLNHTDQCELYSSRSGVGRYLCKGVYLKHFRLYEPYSFCQSCFSLFLEQEDSYSQYINGYVRLCFFEALFMAGEP